MLKIKVNKDSFVKSMQIVEKAIAENKIRPAISGIYVEARGGKIIFRGTNLELTINSVLEGDVIEEGKVVFDFSIVDEYLRQIKEDTIEIIEESGKVTILSANSVSEFVIYDANEYPNLKFLATEGAISIDKNSLIHALEKTRIAAETLGDKLALHCIRLDIENRKMKAVSSDSFRMAYYEEEVDINSDIKLSVSIPLKTVDSLLKIAKVIEMDKVLVKFEGSQILFNFGNTDILSRVIELDFPNYKSIFGSFVHSKTVILKTDELISTLRRVQIFARNNTNAKNGSIFNLTGNKLVIRAISDNAKVKEEVNILKNGNDLKISLNVKFILDFITTVESDNLEMKFNNSNNPVLISGENNDKFVYLTMPLALVEE